MAEKDLNSKIEAVLFACGEPVGIKKLAKFLKISSKQCQDEVDKLEKAYKERGAGLQIIKNNNTIQLASNSKYGELVASFLKKNVNEPLSKAALEVLSVIAYRGPVTRAQIEHIRGVNCSFTLRNLAIRGLIERTDNPADSRAYLYQASNDFIKSLGMRSIEELPDYGNLHSAEVSTEKPPEETKKTPKSDNQ